MKYRALPFCFIAIAVCVYRVPDVGLVMFCMVACEKVALFFTFDQVGKDENEYRDQMIEALGILKRSTID